MPAITKESLLAEKAANQETVANLRDRVVKTDRQLSVFRMELAANTGAGQMIDHLLAQIDAPEEEVQSEPSDVGSAGE